MHKPSHPKEMCVNNSLRLQIWKDLEVHSKTLGNKPEESRIVTSVLSKHSRVTQTNSRCVKQHFRPISSYWLCSANKNGEVIAQIFHPPDTLPVQRGWWLSYVYCGCAAHANLMAETFSCTLVYTLWGLKTISVFIFQVSVKTVEYQICWKVIEGHLVYIFFFVKKPWLTRWQFKNRRKKNVFDICPFLRGYTIPSGSLWLSATKGNHIFFHDTVAKL